MPYINVLLLFCAMSFRRTAISLIIITLVTAGIAAVYLWYNFTARSNLILVVPKDCNWYYHFQTKQIRSKTEKIKPQYLDSIANTIKGIKAFKNVKDPADVGINLFSDIIFFENKSGRFLALSVNSEPRLERFFSELVPKEYIGGITHGGSCNFVKAVNKNLYFAYKHKAMVLFEPFDTTDNLEVLERGLKTIFEQKSKEPVTAIPVVKKLYSEDCDVVFYSAGNKGFPSHGIQIEKDFVIFENSKKNVSELKDYPPFDAAKKIVKEKGMQWTPVETKGYLNQTMQCMYMLLKSYLK